MIAAARQFARGTQLTKGHCVIDLAQGEGYFYIIIEVKDDIILIRDLECAGAACFLSTSTILRSFGFGIAFTSARENITRIVRTAGRFFLIAFGVARTLRTPRVSRFVLLCDGQ